MNITLSLVCDRARQTPDGRIDIEGQYFDLEAPDFPAKHDLTFVAVLEWEVEDHGRYDFEVRVIGPDGTPTPQGIRAYTEVSHNDPEGPPPRTYLVVPMDEVVFLEPGRYRFQVRAKGRDHDGPPLYLRRSGGADAQA